MLVKFHDRILKVLQIFIYVYFDIFSDRSPPPDSPTESTALLLYHPHINNAWTRPTGFQTVSLRKFLTVSKLCDSPVRMGSVIAYRFATMIEHDKLYLHAV